MNVTEPMTAESVLPIIEEQDLTTEELVTYLRQMMEIRAFENNIHELLTPRRS